MSAGSFDYVLSSSDDLGRPVTPRRCLQWFHLTGLDLKPSVYTSVLRFFVPRITPYQYFSREPSADKVYNHNDGQR